MKSGGPDDWVNIESTARWEEAIERQFKPHPEWKVQIKLDKLEWRDKDNWDLWPRAQDAGITLAKMFDSEKEDCGAEDEGEEYAQYYHGHRSEKAVEIIIERGDGADFSVKPDDGRVLRCIDLRDGYYSPPVYKRASDALKKLFRENSWEMFRFMGACNVVDDSLDWWDQTLARMPSSSPEV